MSEPLAIDVFWSFRSPWSYLATPRLLAWKQQYRLTVRFKPVYPIAIRTPDFFSNVPPMWFPYFMRDLIRVAEFLELPLTWPDPDPVVNEPGPDGRQSFPKEQPYIHPPPNVWLFYLRRCFIMAFYYNSPTILAKQWT